MTIVPAYYAKTAISTVSVFRADRARREVGDMERERE